MMEFNLKDHTIPRIHGILLGAVAPRPICFASTLDAEGNPNLSPFSFFNVFGVNPPLCIFSPARRGRDNTVKDTFLNVKEHAEVVINMVSYDMVEQMSLASTEYGRGIDEFAKSGFTAIPSKLVKPFRVKESKVQLECIVKEVIETGQNGGAGNLVICEIVLIHVDESVLDGRGNIDPHLMDQVARLGGDWYSRASAGLFEVAKPLATKGIGVDLLPNYISANKYLIGNDLGKLGNVESLPTAEEITQIAGKPEVKRLFELYKEKEELNQKIAQLAKYKLNKNEVHSALCILMSAQ